MSNSNEKINLLLKKYKKTALSVLIGVHAFILWLYLFLLKTSLGLFSIGIAWLFDIYSYPEHLQSIFYTMFGFFWVLFILAYPVIFAICTILCIAYLPNWQGRHFGRAFLFPGMFAFMTFMLAIIGSGLR